MTQQMYQMQNPVNPTYTLMGASQGVGGWLGGPSTPADARRIGLRGAGV